MKSDNIAERIAIIISSNSMGKVRIITPVEIASKRFLNQRLLAISTGVIILTLPIEFDGLKIIIAILSAILSDLVSNSLPVRIIS